MSWSAYLRLGRVSNLPTVWTNVLAGVALAGGGVGAALYLGFLAWVCYGVWLLVRPGRANIPRAVVSFIAGISLLDGLLMAGAGAPRGAVWGVGGFGLTLLLQRYVRGT